MGVQVDESRRQDAVAAIDDPSVVRCVNAVFRYRIDDAVDDQDVAGLELVVYAVEDTDVFYQYRLRMRRSRNQADQYGHTNAQHLFPLFLWRQVTPDLYGQTSSRLPSNQTFCFPRVSVWKRKPGGRSRKGCRFGM